jgi:hypothetical protein
MTVIPFGSPRTRGTKSSVAVPPSTGAEPLRIVLDWSAGLAKK